MMVCWSAFRVTPANQFRRLPWDAAGLMPFPAQCVVLIVWPWSWGCAPIWRVWRVLFGLLVLVALGLGSFSYATPDRQGYEHAGGNCQQPDPAWYAASGVLPLLSLAPKILQTIAEINPFAHG